AIEASYHGRDGQCHGNDRQQADGFVQASIHEGAVSVTNVGNSSQHTLTANNELFGINREILDQVTVILVQAAEAATQKFLQSYIRRDERIQIVIELAFVLYEDCDVARSQGRDIA